MNFVQNELPDRNFLECWQAAARHLDALGRKAAETAKRPDESVPGFCWQKSDPYGAYFEHLSFFLGSLAVFVQVYDADRRVSFPGTRDRLAYMARGFGDGALACIMPMRRAPKGSGPAWTPAAPGWGLLELVTKKPVDPARLPTDSLIVCTPQELQYFAVNQIMGRLMKEGKEVLSYNADVNGWPSMFFREKEGRLVSYCAVRHCVHPDTFLPAPPDFGAMRRRLDDLGYDGWFAQVAFRNIDQKDGEPPMPVFRGFAVDVEFRGPEPLPSGRLQ